MFVIVGLVAASIFLWILFAIRRRRRQRRLEHDATVSDTLAAAGLSRRPLDDDDDRTTPNEMAQRSRTASFPSAGYFDTYPAGYPSGSAETPRGEFDPYTDYTDPFRREGYVQARTTSPPPSPGSPFGGTGPGHDRASYSGHAATHSAGSYEPLLAAAALGSNRDPTPPPLALSPTPSRNGIPSPPPRNPLRVSNVQPDLADAEYGPVSPVVTDDGAHTDDRLNPRLIGGDGGSSRGELRDDTDYSRPVLQVCSLSGLGDCVSVYHIHLR